MSMYRICRVLIFALLIASLVYPRVGDSAGMGHPQDPAPVGAPNARAPNVFDDGLRPIVRFTVACRCAEWVYQPIEINMPIGMLALRIHLLRRGIRIHCQKNTLQTTI